MTLTVLEAVTMRLVSCCGVNPEVASEKLTRTASVSLGDSLQVELAARIMSSAAWILKVTEPGATVAAVMAIATDFGCNGRSAAASTRDMAAASFCDAI